MPDIPTVLEQHSSTKCHAVTEPVRMFLALQYKHRARSQMCFHLCFLLSLLCCIHGKYCSAGQEHSLETSFWRPRPATNTVQTSAILLLAEPASLLNVSIGNIGFCVNVDYVLLHREEFFLVRLSCRMSDWVNGFPKDAVWKHQTGNPVIWTLW